MEQERVRLLLIDGTKDSRGSYISSGVGNIVGKWPSYIAAVVWCSVCIATSIAFITILFLSLIIHERFENINRQDERGEQMLQNTPSKLENEFCKRATSRENHIAARSIDLTLVPDCQIQDTSENIFYSLIEPLDMLQACSVESVLRLCPDKFIYLMHFNGNNYRILNKYETFLKRRYSNMNVIRANGPRYVKASPFEGNWRGDNSSLYATNLLTVFQFGGTTLSPNIIMKDRKLLDYDTPNCLVDKELLFCPEQCSPFVYELITTLNKHLNNRFNGSESIVDTAIWDFCGGKVYTGVGCAGVTRIDESIMCTTNAQHCLFIRSKEWASRDDGWKLEAEPFCPEIIKSFPNDK